MAAILFDRNVDAAVVQTIRHQMAVKTYMVLREDEDGSIIVKARTGCRHRDMMILLLLMEHEADATTELTEINQKSTIYSVYGNIGEIREAIYNSSEFDVEEPERRKNCTKENIHYVGPSVYGRDGELRHVVLGE